ncbi:MAG: prepilin-type N-terminal cleavage/methylation domain-containing protein [Deltaproteobacteria bacterium]|nr:prepilin-type N-terminal cleavage/methylation domain-containing protein [Deltaproteobacteria bacterium]
MRQRGFTLMEVMVALAILAIALVVVFSHQVASIDLGNEAMIITKATLLAQEKMTELIAQERLATGENEGEVQEGVPPFRWKTTVEDAEPEGMRRVMVIVKWKEGDKERDLDLVTYVAPQE